MTSQQVTEAEFPFTEAPQEAIFSLVLSDHIFITHLPSYRNGSQIDQPAVPKIPFL